MSILIKGMEMPKNCEVCPLNFYECALLEKSSEEIMQYFGGNSRHPDCPLIEVPTPHGRLIDADALMENAQYKGKHDIVTAYDIVAAPTIIESEE